MSHEPSWRKVAEVLAERLRHAAPRAGSVSPLDITEADGCRHSEAEADPDNCPFCADRAAFQVYQRKLRSTATGSNSGDNS
jgi:hypothetical protein